MKPLFLIFALLFVAQASFAQDTKLQPIKAEYGFFKFRPYTYGEMKFGNPRKLQIPIMTLGDEQATRYYKRFQVYNTLGDVFSIGAFIPLGISIINSNNEGKAWNSSPAYVVWGGMILAGSIFHLIGINQLNKSIKHYNEALGSRVNMSLTNPVQGQMGLGIGITYSLSK